MLPIHIALRIENDEDRALVESIYETYGRKMYLCARKYLRDESDGWCAVHDAILVLSDYLQEYKAWSEQHQINFLCKCTTTFAIKESVYQRKRNYFTVSLNDNEKAPELELEDETQNIDAWFFSQENSRLVHNAIENMKSI